MSFNQQAMWDRLHSGLAEYQAANADFSSRASLLLGASVGAFAAIGAVLVLPNQANPLVLFPACLAAVVSLAMVALAGSLWQPRASSVPGDGDITAMYRQYLSKNVDDAYFLAMRDTAVVYQCEKEQNAERANRLKWMLWCLDAQIVLLTIAMVLHAVR